MTDCDFLGAGEPGALEALYRRFLDDPHAVSRDVARAFARMLEESEQLSFESLSHLKGRIWGHRAARFDPLAETIRTGPPAEDHPLAAAYTGSIGWQFMHVPDAARREWLAVQAEGGEGLPSTEERLNALDLLVDAEALEEGLQRRFPTIKRFGLEGAEGYLVLCEAILRESVAGGIERVVMGGMHRGRLNVLANLLHKPLAALIAEMTGTPPVPKDLKVSADVAYHNGFSCRREISGCLVRLTMLPHPSHLSVVAPVTLGKARAVQARGGGARWHTVLPLVMHTDAAFAGQGVIAETLQIARLAPFTVAGTIHLVLDNGLGFTTLAEEGRSALYSSDAALMTGVPVIHVNGEDPDALLRVGRIAAAYRARFGEDIVVTLHAYRRRGHNEIDDPRFTQPLLYQTIDARPSIRARYEQRLREDGVDTSRGQRRAADYRERMEAAAEAAKSHHVNKAGRFGGVWTGLRLGHIEDMTAFVDTGVDVSRLRALGISLAKVPEGFRISPKLQKLLGERRRSIEEGEGINWATAEALALATLGAEGYGVRLGGQDTPRGAFSQRHLILHDQATGDAHSILAQTACGGHRVEIFNTPLSEYAVVAFEYGYSLGDPHTLVCWEAQFGDFINLAQAVMDQFIACGEDRWLRSSGLVLLLPHGLDGGGPDHSTAHPERLLNACAGANLQVTNASTPAQYFHLLRRQMLRDFRKPLVVLTPKVLLRNRACVSKLGDFAPGTGFRSVLAAGGEGARRVVLCSGKIYYELAAEREKRGLDSQIALVRVEQLYPLDAPALRAALTIHPNAEFVWCQEEPENMGPFRVLDRALEAVVGRRLEYAGRLAAPSPATGVHDWHECERRAVLDAALG